MRPVLLVVGGWVLAAGVAALLGVLAVNLLGSGVAGGTGTALRAEDVDRELARVGEPSPALASVPPSTAPSGDQDEQQDDTGQDDAGQDEEDGGDADEGDTPGGDLQTVDTPGGSIIARCQGSVAELVSWTPRQGFDADEEATGPGEAAYLEFSSDEAKVHVTVGCRGGELVPLVVTGEDD